MRRYVGTFYGLGVAASTLPCRLGTQRRGRFIARWPRAAGGGRACLLAHSTLKHRRCRDNVTLVLKPVGCHGDEGPQGSSSTNEDSDQPELQSTATSECKMCLD